MSAEALIRFRGGPFGGERRSVPCRADGSPPATVLAGTPSGAYVLALDAPTPYGTEGPWERFYAWSVTPGRNSLEVLPAALNVPMR